MHTNSHQNLFIGTSGFSYDDWRGPFYPSDLASGEMLAWYARFFNCVEINVSFYTIPAATTFQRMAAQTPDHFKFIIKLNRETTHTRKDGLSYIQYLKEATKPLEEAGKFAGFLAQFPYSFKNNQVNRSYLSQIARTIGEGQPFFTEFRHESWPKPALYNFLKDLKCDYVNVDQPELKGLLPAQKIITYQNSYFRFHGRNSKEWWDGKGSARYDYEYNEDELYPWMVSISETLKTAYKNYVFFNNHPTAKAVRNAQMLQQMLATYMESSG